MSEHLPPSPKDRRSVLLVVDSDAPPPSVLEAAATFAAEWQAQLAGLFVEDIDLLRAAALPCSSELDFTTAAIRPLESFALARTLSQRAESMRAALAQMCTTSRIDWTFRISQGEFVRETLAAAGEAELFIVCRASRSAPSTGGKPPLRPPGRRTAPAVLAVLDGGIGSSRVLRVAARLSRLFGAPLVVAFAASPDAASPGAATSAALRTACRRLLSELKVEAAMHDVAVDDALQLLEAAQRWKSGWLVIGRDCALLDEVHLRRLAVGLGHPIVLVQTPMTETAAEKI
ncbi:MAG: hypothetical protein RIC55_10930 [Pirellulaceae bacterium]